MNIHSGSDFNKAYGIKFNDNINISQVNGDIMDKIFSDVQIFISTRLDVIKNLNNAGLHMNIIVDKIFDEDNNYNPEFNCKIEKGILKQEKNNKNE